ncbi:MAG: hypothetical protein ACRD6R_08380 [Candidatus Polarisedimenticolia bacterium]
MKPRAGWRVSGRARGGWDALEDNTFTQAWGRLAGELPRPRAILSVSAQTTGGGSITGPGRSSRICSRTPTCL